MPENSVAVKCESCGIEIEGEPCPAGYCENCCCDICFGDEYDEIDDDE